MTSVGARLKSKMAGISHAQFTMMPAAAPEPATAASTQSPPRQKQPKLDDRDMRTAFAIFDQDQDGRVSSDDVTSTLRLLGHNVKDEDAEKFIDKVTHGGSYLREDDFYTWSEANEASSRCSILESAFQTLDRDSDGYVTKDDLSFGLKITRVNLSPCMLEVMFDEADQDRDGRIDYRDFLQALGERR